MGCTARKGCANKGDRERGAAVGGGRGKATDMKIGQGRKRKIGGRVYLFAYMLFFMV